jgi:hypothetical protein
MEAASVSSAASPSKSIAPMIAPRNGPDIRSHSIGGPAWSNRLSFMPGMTSIATATAFKMGLASIIRLTAVVLASSIFIDSPLVIRKA